MNVLDLFSGIGGFSLGLGRAGLRTIAFCENDLFCRRVLAKHWPGIPIHGDIRELDGEQYRRTIDVVCGGFPCQPFSVAGNRRGEADDRALWPEMLRLVHEVRPTWVIGENVIGFVSMGLDDCMSDLENNGYQADALIIPACAVGAPHRRDRVWIVGNSNGNSESTRAVNAAASGLMGATAANANDSGRQQQRWRQPAREEYKTAQCGIGWPTEPPLCGADDGISGRVDRLRALGNAVVPQIPEVIGRAIVALSEP